MLPALHLTGVAGIAPGLACISDPFNCCVSIYRTASKVIYFYTQLNRRSPGKEILKIIAGKSSP